VQLEMHNEETSSATEKLKLPASQLVKLVKLSEKREFCEEIDELEVMYKASSYF
jgi:hypothetical protein